MEKTLRFCDFCGPNTVIEEDDPEKRFTSRGTTHDRVYDFVVEVKVNPHKDVCRKCIIKHLENLVINIKNPHWSEGGY